MVRIIDYRKNARGRNARFTFTNISFTRSETIDLLKSWVALSFAYTFTHMTYFYYFPMYFLVILPIATIVAGLTFVVHELSHKFTAEHYELDAHYKSNDWMLVLGLMISFSGFLFFAPGAVMIDGYYMTRRQYGITAAAGPISNLVIATIFLPLYWLFPWVLFIQYAFTMNAWIGLYNMIPVGMFDGAKVYKWSPGVYLVLVACAIALLVFVYVDPWLL